jgi:uncharacterized protein YydD (DUF2326 family)
MIYRVFSDLPNFKTLSFQSGLNILLADKTQDATDRQTRNGAGKTSLIELIHFLTGSNVSRDSIFRTEALRQATFGMEFDLGPNRAIVTRMGAKPSQVNVQGLSLQGEQTLLPSAGESIRNEDWRALLGLQMFGLPEHEEKWGPSFRSLFSYFVRRQENAGFQDPFRHTGPQQVWDQQVALSYLVGLDWRIAQEWQQVRERHRSLQELRKAFSEDGVFESTIGTVATLRTELVLSENAARLTRDNLSRFRVIDEYETLESEASMITRELAQLADANTLDRELLSDLEAAISSEIPPQPTDLERLYEEVGVQLPERTLSRFADVVSFHDSVVRNRQLYLQEELAAARDRLASREARKTQLDTRRSQIMTILRSGGALEQFTELQTELSRLEAKTEVTRERFHAAQQFETESNVLDLERQRLVTQLNQDLQERAATLSEAIVTFERLSSELYGERAGSLTVSVSRGGPKFDVEIHGERSKGIQNMQIFCFDMTLVRLAQERGLGPGFLVHDSHLFDGVDERQVARALQVGARNAQELAFQYIVTMNTDAVPTMLPQGFSLDAYVLPVRLTDATEDGGLFGLRFQ